MGRCQSSNGRKRPVSGSSPAPPLAMTSDRMWPASPSLRGKDRQCHPTKADKRRMIIKGYTAWMVWIREAGLLTADEVSVEP